MITHYGLFWSERDVFWGRQKKAGQLLGKPQLALDRRGAPTTAEREQAEDYRDYIGLYCLYGQGQLIYVGEAGLGTTSTIFARLNKHRRGTLAGRWNAFSWFGRADCNGQADVLTGLKQLEAVAIAIINPGFNKQSGTFDGAAQVFQQADDRSVGDLETKIDRLAAMLERPQGQE